MNLSWQEEVLPAFKEEDVIVEEELGEKSLMVYNDDFNTFDHVIKTLMKVCNHTLEQAEQCTWLIHYKGKCCVKVGSYAKLKPMKDGICEAGIKAAIV